MAVVDVDYEAMMAGSERRDAPVIAGILETVLYVDDLERATAFYRDVVGLTEIFRDDRMVAYGVARDAVLLLFERGRSLHPVKTPGGTIPPHDGQGPAHMAFLVPELDRWEARLGDCRVAIESRERWPRGGTSLYFRDPSGNLLEFATPGLWSKV